MEEFLFEMVDWIILAVEAAGATTIAIGFLLCLVEIGKGVLRHGDDFPFVRVRLIFARYLSLALEFQLAADILSTIMLPTWEEIGKLGAIAVIRTFLNYFLQKEIHEEQKLVNSERDMTEAGADGD